MLLSFCITLSIIIVFAIGFIIEQDREHERVMAQLATIQARADEAAGLLESARRDLVRSNHRYLDIVREQKAALEKELAVVVVDEDNIDDMYEAHVEDLLGLNDVPPKESDEFFYHEAEDQPAPSPRVPYLTAGLRYTDAKAEAAIAYTDYCRIDALFMTDDMPADWDDQLCAAYEWCNDAEREAAMYYAETRSHLRHTRYTHAFTGGICHDALDMDLGDDIPF